MNLVRGCLGLVLLLSVAEAAPNRGTATHGHPFGDGMCGTPTAEQQSRAGRTGLRHAAAPSKIIFLDRCADGCTFTGATDHDAINDKTAISGTMPGQVYAFPPFTNFAGESGAAADAQWNQVVECARKVYSYYDTVVTDVRPTSGTYHRAVVSGFSHDFLPEHGQNGLLGISDVDFQFGCAPIHNMSSFTFAESHKPFAFNAERYVKNLCWTVTHEVGHSFGLEHEFEYVDATSACSDPMSYDTGSCDPPVRFFRNKPAKCGGFELTPCSCGGGVANSHPRLTNVFGSATVPPSILPPIARVVTPGADDQVGPIISTEAGHERGIERVDLFINGFLWATMPGARFTTNGGQPNPSSYHFQVPDRVPDSVVDIQIKAYDDLGELVESPVVTAVKGAPCADASTCATGQRCEEGRCFWDPPVGEIGDECTYSEFCLSGKCSNESLTADVSICTTQFIAGTADACPNGLECIETGNGGVCYLASEGGCCSASTSTPWGPLVMGLFVVGYVLRRRRAVA